MKTPAFQFYPGDFLSSPDVQMMNTQEVGAYCLLLFNSWIITDRPGYLPNNERKLQRLSKLTEKEWDKIKDVILEKFPVTPDGEYRYNKRLIEEYDKQEIRRLRLAANGAKGGRPPKPDDNLLVLELEPKNNLQVNSSKPNTKQEQRLSSSSSLSSSFSTSTSTLSDNVGGSPPKKEISFEKKYESFILLFNSICKRKFKGDVTSKGQFNARLKEGKTGEDFRKAITNGFNDSLKWQSPDHFTPDYLTRPAMFEKYLSSGEHTGKPAGRKESVAERIARQNAPEPPRA